MKNALVALAALWIGIQGAHAQGLEDQTVHQRFACLQREKALEELPPKTVENNNSGLLRFKLRFEKADKAPRIELLHGAADSDMERIARRYLSGFRVPCLHEGDHPIEVVQEFSFSRWGNEPAVPLPGKTPVMRFHLPDEVPQLRSYDIGRALVEYTFVAGKEAPDVRFVFSSAGRDAQRVVERYAKQLRLLDSGGQPRPVTVRQPWNFVDPQTRGTQYRLSKDEYPLLELLRLTKNLNENLVDIDLDTMQCPFAVRLSIRQPYEANLVREIETTNPNRAYLLDWLSKLQLRFKDEQQQKDLFGSDLRIAIPCGRLDLTVLRKPASSS